VEIMISCTLWEQHRRTFKVAGCELRYLRFVDHQKATTQAGITAEDLAFIQRLQAKKALDPAGVLQEEINREASIMNRWPLLDTWAACFVHPVLEDGDHLKAWLYQLDEDDRTTLKYWLQELSDPEIKSAPALEFLPVLGGLGFPVAKDLDMINLTLQQGLLLFGQAAAALQAQKQALDARGD
jgi:hypothetical protein